jgi:hypothetical protein
LSDPYIWHFLLIPIRKGSFSPHLCHLLSPHLWYWYLEIEKCYTFYCVRLLIPSWLMYSNNSFKAFIHFFELGQFAMQFILKKILVFSKKFIRKKDILGNVHLVFIFGCCRYIDYLLYFWKVLITSHHLLLFFSLECSQVGTNTLAKTWKIKTLNIMASSTSQCRIIILFWIFHVKYIYSCTY